MDFLLFDRNPSSSFFLKSYNFSQSPSLFLVAAFPFGSLLCSGECFVDRSPPNLLPVLSPHPDSRNHLRFFLVFVRSLISHSRPLTLPREMPLCPPMNVFLPRFWRIKDRFPHIRLFFFEQYLNSTTLSVSHVFSFLMFFFPLFRLCSAFSFFFFYFAQRTAPFLKVRGTHLSVTFSPLQTFLHFSPFYPATSMMHWHGAAYPSSSPVLPLTT